MMQEDKYFEIQELKDINYCIKNLDWEEPVEDLLFINLLEDELIPQYRLFKNN